MALGRGPGVGQLGSLSVEPQGSLLDLRAPLVQLAALPLDLRTLVLQIGALVLEAGALLVEGGALDEAVHFARSRARV